MRRRILLSILLSALCPFLARAQKQDIIKTGLNFGPLPVVALDPDKGFQYGALLNIYDYGDGSSYPNYNSKWYVEASFFTKGTQQYVVSYDNKVLIPGIRWSSAVMATIEKAMDFYGFNGYQSWYDQERIALGNANKKGPQDPAQFIYTPFYRNSRVQILAKTDFIGKITDALSWEAGYHASWFKEGAVDRTSINKGKDDYNIYPDSQPTLFELYRKWGLISDEEAEGGFSSSIRLGLVYDTRDKEGAPSRGIWAEGHLTAAPKWLGTKNPFYRYSLTFRHYVPLVQNNVLTLAYRLNYEGTLGQNAPYYVLPYITVMGDLYDRDGMGGYRTVRGLMRNRVVGLDMATYNLELRWRFISFQALKQNISLALNIFSDGTMVTRGRDMSLKGPQFASPTAQSDYIEYISKGAKHDTPHITAGVGFRFIMNENFVVAVEYGAPISRFYGKNHPLYNQDGPGAFYINTGYLF
ncbi:MAG: BamA/TamA family outer membrane protein [Bacteroidales bacterium]|nr:BamA/TamA family outer membrane protein [Bacteroidales bacterium]